MCTLSWQHTKDGYNVLFNRDELRSRPQARPPEAVGPGSIAPIDPEGGGSWIAANQYGVTVCLLNWYAAMPERASGAEHNQTCYVSRGAIVLQAAEARQLADVARCVHNLPLQQYRPFLLWAIAPDQSPMLLRWSGWELIEELAVESPITTSSVHTRRALCRRKRLYKRIVGKSFCADKVHRLQFHRSRFRLWASDSVAMNRKISQTVSLTDVSVDANYVTMRYVPGNPADTGSPAATVSGLLAAHQQVIARTPSESLPGCSVPKQMPSRVLNIRKAFQSKNPELARRLPHWVFTMIALVLQQGRINRQANILRPLSCRRFPAAALHSLAVSGAVTGPVPPLQSQRPVFVANHPLGGIDGLAMIQQLLRWYPRIQVVSNDILSGLPHLTPFLVPVDTYHGRRSIVQTLHNAFSSEACILVFPAGRTARMHSGRLREFSWNKMAVRMALQYQRPVVPVYIKAANSYWFYLIHRVRSMLGIAWNLEMFLLPHELLKPATRRLAMVRGTALYPDQLQKKGAHNQERSENLQYICERCLHG